MATKPFDRSRTMCPRDALLAAAIAAHAGAYAQPCPSDTAPRDAEVLLTAQVADGRARDLKRSDLESLPPRQVSLRRAVEREGARDEQILSYGGWLLRDVLTLAGFDEAGRRDTRTWVVEATATDGYRAVFSWGELYNSALGEQVYVIGSQDGRALDVTAGPLALRSLADQRPGPRHVRNLCALAVRPLPAR
ncbi:MULTISPECIES: hypothetical protein [Methylibium]|uniref:Oxidoreductase molybdopterin-binding domain-containing protein n=2 Tax=Methylibium TaxID=316612 RepID=A2SHX4_METPP|nr:MULTISPECIES: hypothetical protein [Methylibium]ABM95163.1 hypothetical protein Mpe_A2207 [Methylibium petroleiphilum PM1]